MSLLAVPIIAVLALFLVLLLTTIFFIYLNKFKQTMAVQDMQIQSTSLMVNELQLLNEKLQQKLEAINSASDKAMIENRQVTNQLEHRIKNLQLQASEQQQLLAQWQDSQGQDKFYNRAFKLAEKGAGIDEIINECELPRAEVEMLLSVYKQRNDSQ
jgi:dolichyl-phosphate-mannose--protein O-mannosyl transferase